MKKYFFPGFVSLLTSFVFVLYIPLLTYYLNINEFPFSAKSLIINVLPCFFVVFIATFLVLFLLRKKIPVKQVNFAKYKVSITPAEVFLICIVFLLWLEGNILNIGLPQLTGVTNPFNSTPRLLLDSAVWLVLLVLGGVFWRKIALKLIPISLMLLLVLCIGLTEARINRDKKIVHPYRQDILKNISFGNKQNTLVIVSDSFPTDIAIEIFNTNPDYAEAFEGFTMLQNNLAAGSGTNYALPTMFRGSIYDKHVVDFINNALKPNQSSLLDFLLNSDYDVYISSTRGSLNFIHNQSIKALRKNSDVDINAELCAIFFVKFAPYGLKSFLEEQILHKNSTSEELAEVENLNKFSIIHDDILIPALKSRTDRPTFNFHHTWGVHPPYVLDSEGKTLPKEKQRGSLDGLKERAKYEIKLFMRLINAMKAEGLYDNSTIIFMADHGDHSLMNGKNRPVGKLSTHDYPLFMFKAPFNQGKLQISNAPFSIAYLPNFIKICIDRPEEIDNFLANLPPLRYQYKSKEYVKHVLGVNEADYEDGLYLIIKGVDPASLEIGISKDGLPEGASFP